jgi:dTDP-4-amino-4,6-dideoxygalactose transaminase
MSSVTNDGLIAFHRIFNCGEESTYVADSFERMCRGDANHYHEIAIDALSSRVGHRRIHLTPSATAALDSCAMLLQLQPGDEVIVPSFTFVTSASTFASRGAQIVFVDVSDDLCIDVQAVEAAITPRTRAIVVVHYAGNACDMAALLALCRARGVLLIEDAAHAMGATWCGRALGSIGDLGVYSFHSTKNLTCGEGGALLVNNASFDAAADCVVECGTNRASFMRGNISHYEWIADGSAYTMSALCAAVLAAQVRHCDTIIGARVKRFNQLRAGLLAIEQQGHFRMPAIRADCQPSAHIFCLVLPSEQQRIALQAHLKAANIDCRTHYVALHSSVRGRQVGRAVGACPRATHASTCLLRLPLHPYLIDSDIERICNNIAQFFHC